MSEPRGPVYTDVARARFWGNPAVHARRDTIRAARCYVPRTRARRDRRSRALIAKAEFPLIVTSSVGRNPAAVDQLAALAQEFAIPVVQSEARDFNLPTDHAMHIGYEPGAWIGKADVILVLDKRGAVDFPSAPAGAATPRSSISRRTRWRAATPFREIEADLLIAGDPCAALRLLREALGGRARAKNGATDGRRKTIATRARGTWRKRKKKLIETAKDQTPIHPAWLAHCINQIKSEDAIVISELGVPLAHLNMTRAALPTWAGSFPAGSASGSAPGSAQNSRRPSAR